jgi:protein-L-isoaspartate O-methyltransferase
MKQSNVATGISFAVAKSAKMVARVSSVDVENVLVASALQICP